MLGKQETACHLVTIHNIAFQLQLMTDMRDAIIADSFPEFVTQFMAAYFARGCPGWVADALASVGLDLPRAQMNDE